MKTAEIRKAFLDYFVRQGHTVVDSSSLIPAGDPTLLFTNAGMVQFKDCFLGAEKRDYVRAASCQKCLRISGKHNDLENVGLTARHHTFFEMLGNFSFGDYFKEDAIKFAWEFLTEVVSLPKDRLWVTVFEDDDEAAELWKKHTDVLEGRILRCGEKDNFWAMGDTGPCGPCSELFYYLGSDVKAQSEEDFRKNEDLYIEIWNLVFMQYNREPSGKLTALPKPSVDTGMGLERIAAVKQGVPANYDSDLLRAIIGFTEKLAGLPYNGSDYSRRDPNSDKHYAVDVAFRVAADHVRAAAFLVAEGVNPASDGRGYVLRRLIRRACRHGRVLGFKEAFLCKVGGEVVRLMGEAYPELKRCAKKIEKIIQAEEEKFLVTLDTGIGILDKEVQVLKKRDSRVFPGHIAFQLHDTYGFPLDMTEDIVRGHGLKVDTDAFSAEMEKQRERSRSARASETELILQRSVKPIGSKFVGYDFPAYESKISGVFTADGEVKAAKEGEEVAVVAAETPFYAEAGGQVGDTGSISTANGSFEVIDTQRVGPDTIVHIGKVLEGEIQPGSAARLEIEEGRREKLRMNHSATHLLHYALRKVLGDHVKQAGSRVADQSLRFDFSHYNPPAAEQLTEIEALINEEIRANHEVTTEIMPRDKALQLGAMALFGEKYGKQVRVVRIGPNSLELCGGTHTKRSGDIGVVTLGSEGSISAGVRRIEAFGGPGATQRLAQQKAVLKELSAVLKTGEHDLADRVMRVLEANKALERQVESLSQQTQQVKGGDLSEQAVNLPDGRKVVASVLEGATPKQLREMADDLKQRLGSGCIALGSSKDGKAILLTAVTDDLVQRYHAGKLLGEIAEVIGGRGGGRPDLAQAGGGDPKKLDAAMKRFQELVS